MPRRFTWIFVGLGFFLGVVLGAWGVVLSSDTASTASVEQVRALIEAQQQASTRADCRTGIASALQSVRDDRLSTTLNVVFTHKPSGTPLTQAELDLIQAANVAVTNLPRISDAVNHGATIDGIRYLPCPKVVQ